MEQSPAELLMNRKLRTKLPITKHLLKPKAQPVSEVQQRLRACQLCQKLAYDQGTKQLSSLQPKESLRIRNGIQSWSLNNINHLVHTSWQLQMEHCYAQIAII